MIRSIKLLMSTAIVVAGFSSPVFAQTSGQAVAPLTKVDAQALTTGHRASKVIGSTVINEAQETIGTIDDLIITSNEKIPFAILSVGGFLGMGTKNVAVPYNAFSAKDDKLMLPGATKEMLKSLPDFTYNK